MFGNLLFMLLLLLIVGVIFLSIVRSAERAREIEELRRSRSRYAATVTSISHKRVYAGQVGNIPQYRENWYIEADWTDPRTGNTHHFKSDRLNRYDAMRLRLR